MEIFGSLFAAFVLVFPAYLISLGVSGSKKNNEKAVQKAISRGHVVTAVLKKQSAPKYNVPGTQSLWSSQGTYEYEYNGKRYTYRIWAESHAPTLTLYFVSNPRRASVRKALTNSKICWPAVFLAVAVLAYLVMKA